MKRRGDAHRGRRAAAGGKADVWDASGCSNGRRKIDLD